MTIGRSCTSTLYTSTIIACYVLLATPSYLGTCVTLKWTRAVKTPTVIRWNDGYTLLPLATVEQVA